jgi:hypothetical protein
MKPSEIPGTLSIEVYIERLSGSRAFWQRLNLGFVFELRRQFMIWQTLREDIQERTPGRHGRWLWRAARYRDDLRLEGIILADIEGSAHQWSLIGNKIAGHDGGGRGGNLGGFPGDARAEPHRSDLTSSLQGSYDRARSNAMETG